MPGDLERDLGRLEGQVAALLEEMRSGFRRIDVVMTRHAEERREQFSAIGRRLRALEMWRAFLLGGAALAAVLFGAWKTLTGFLVGGPRG